MKLPEDISTELEALISAHYYSEDFELLSSFKAYAGALQEQELSYLKQVALARLADEGSLVDVMLCSAVDVPSAVPILVEKLNNEQAATQTSRALIVALGRYTSPDAYLAVERFVDSDQEQEALESLSRIDFVRALPHVFRRLHDERYYNVLLKILSDRSLNVGLEVMISNLLGSLKLNTRDFREALMSLLYSKKDPYNPFSQDDIHRIIEAMGDM